MDRFDTMKGSEAPQSITALLCVVPRTIKGRYQINMLLPGSHPYGPSGGSSPESSPHRQGSESSPQTSEKKPRFATPPPPHANASVMRLAPWPPSMTSRGYWGTAPWRKAKTAISMSCWPTGRSLPPPQISSVCYFMDVNPTPTANLLPSSLMHFVVIYQLFFLSVHFCGS